MCAGGDGRRGTSKPVSRTTRWPGDMRSASPGEIAKKSLSNSTTQASEQNPPPRCGRAEHNDRAMCPPLTGANLAELGGPDLVEVGRARASQIWCRRGKFGRCRAKSDRCRPKPTQVRSNRPVCGRRRARVSRFPAWPAQPESGSDLGELSPRSTSSRSWAVPDHFTELGRLRPRLVEIRRRPNSDQRWPEFERFRRRNFGQLWPAAV